MHTGHQVNLTTLQQWQDLHTFLWNLTFSFAEFYWVDYCQRQKLPFFTTLALLH